MVSLARRILAEIPIPQQLLIASAVTYGAVFALLLEYGRPGLGIGEGFFVAVILAAAATSPLLGAAAGFGARRATAVMCGCCAWEFRWASSSAVLRPLS